MESDRPVKRTVIFEKPAAATATREERMSAPIDSPKQEHLGDDLDDAIVDVSGTTPEHIVTKRARRNSYHRPSHFPDLSSLGDEAAIHKVRIFFLLPLSASFSPPVFRAFFCLTPFLREIPRASF
jgi:hypothetical protein